MATTREEVMQALQAALVSAGLVVERNCARPAQPSKDGLVMLRDGDPGEPEILLGDPEGAYLWTHLAEIEVAVERADEARRHADLDDLLRRVDLALAADPTLGGRCDQVQPGAPVIEHEGREGGRHLAVAAIRVALDYSTASPMGV